MPNFILLIKTEKIMNHAFNMNPNFLGVPMLENQTQPNDFVIAQRMDLFLTKVSVFIEITGVFFQYQTT